MSAAANKELVAKFWREVGASDYGRLIDELYAPEAKYHGAGGEDLTGTEQLKDYAGGYFKAFPDMQFEAKTIFGEGDWVASRWEATGTHTGDMVDGPAATNKTAVISGATIQRFDDGKVVEEWEYPDMTGLMAQLGVM